MRRELTGGLLEGAMGNFVEGCRTRRGEWKLCLLQRHGREWSPRRAVGGGVRGGL